MRKLTVASSKDGFLDRGETFFYLADTVWHVFSSATEEEWEQYLDVRKAQGFNAVQISVLPILHDTSETPLLLLPFHIGENGAMDYFRINDAYFERAARMVEMAASRGFVVALFVLWSVYVKGTWVTTKRTDQHVMPFEAIAPYAAYVARTFRRYRPIYSISGDTDIPAEETAASYLNVLQTIKKHDPEGLTTMHLFPNAELPEAFVQSELLDFYMYQSGHKLEEQHLNYTIAEKFLQVGVKRPIVNGEPCYEGHGHGFKYGRFDAFSVRKAFWQSTLGGAKAGFAYGAHGLWSWHRKGSGFSHQRFSKMPFDWRTALHFEGARDAAYSSWLFRQCDLFDVEPRNEWLINDMPDIRVAATPDLRTVAVYAPYSIDISLRIDLSPYRFEAIELSTRYVGQPDVKADGDGSVIGIMERNSDFLFIGRVQYNS